MIHLGALFGLCLLTTQELLSRERGLSAIDLPQRHSLLFVKPRFGLREHNWHRKWLLARKVVLRDSGLCSALRQRQQPFLCQKVFRSATTLLKMSCGDYSEWEPVPGKTFCYFSPFRKDCKVVGFVVASSNPHKQVDVWEHSFLSLDTVKLPHIDSRTIRGGLRQLLIDRKWIKFR